MCVQAIPSSAQMFSRLFFLTRALRCISDKRRLSLNLAQEIYLLDMLNGFSEYLIVNSSIHISPTTSKISFVSRLPFGWAAEVPDSDDLCLFGAGFS